MIRRVIRKWKLDRQLRAAISAGAVELDEGVTFAPGFELKLAGSERTQLRVGRNSHLDGRLVTRGTGTISIGAHCSFRGGTFMGAVAGISIGNSVFGAEGVFIIDNNNHPVDPGLREAMTLAPMGTPPWQWTTPGVASAPVVIGDNIWLGRNSAILKGVHLGAGCVVALGAIVVKGAPAFSVLAGNPATVVKTIGPTDLA